MSSRWSRLSPEQKLARLQYQKQYRRSFPEKTRESGRRSERKRKLKRYGLTETSYAHLLTRQNFKCAICLSSTSGQRDWHVDHCHKTNQVRGLLCHHCNLMLGHARDSVTNLEAGIAYLIKFNVG